MWSILSKREATAVPGANKNQGRMRHLTIWGLILTVASIVIMIIIAAVPKREPPPPTVTIPVQGSGIQYNVVVVAGDSPAQDVRVTVGGEQRRTDRSGSVSGTLQAGPDTAGPLLITVQPPEERQPRLGGMVVDYDPGQVVSIIVDPESEMARTSTGEIVRLFQIRIEDPDQDAALMWDNDRVLRYVVRGSSEGALTGSALRRHRLYLLVRPTLPPGAGWYLQDVPATISLEDGSWSGIVQFGYEHRRPRRGDRFQLVAILAEKPAVEDAARSNALRYGERARHIFATLQDLPSHLESQIVDVRIGSIGGATMSHTQLPSARMDVNG